MTPLLIAAGVLAAIGAAVATGARDARIAALGLAVGLPLAFLLMQFVSRVLYGVVVVDTLTLGIFTLVLAGAAVVAGYIPARQASRVDPLTALRAD